MQILTVHKSKSIKGLSILSFELDLFIPAIHSSYGYIMGLDISAYGEAVMSFLQGVILVHAIYRYGKVPMRRQSMIFALLCLGGALVYSGMHCVMLSVRTSSYGLIFDEQSLNFPLVAESHSVNL